MLASYITYSYSDIQPALILCTELMPLQAKGGFNVAMFNMFRKTVYPYHNISIKQVIKKYQFYDGNKEVCLLPVL